MTKYIILLLFILVLMGCLKQDKHRVITEKSASGATHKIVYGDIIIANVAIDKDGNIISVVNPINETQQVVSYHPGSQFVLGKAIQDSNFKQQGVAYFFNDKDELLHSVFQYEDDERVRDGFSFHDGMNAVKQYMLFDSSGNITYRRTYDEFGKHLVTEGNYPPPNE